MARTVEQIQINLISQLVAYAASIGITINPNDWIYVPGNLSETDYKLLLLNTVASGIAIEEQENDLFNTQQETLIASSAPQTGLWFQFQMLMFQFNATIPQVPQIQPSFGTSPLSVIWSPVNATYRVIAFCSVPPKQSGGTCRIKVAAISNGLPVNLDSIYPGALAAAFSFTNLIAAPGISYVVTSGNSDWLYLQLDVFFNGVFSAVIFATVQAAITAYLNNIPFDGIFKLSSLEEAILAVDGVEDMDFVNVWARPDVAYPGSTLTTWGTTYQNKLVSLNTENNKSYSTAAGYIAVENGTSTGGSIANSKLGDFRVGSSGLLNLNCVAV